MKTSIRLMSVCSLVMAGAVMTPAVASADSAEDTVSSAATHGSKQKLFERALDEAQLRPEQRSEVDKLISEARERYAPVKQAKGELMLAVADQIESGKVDRCRLTPQTKALASSMAKAHPQDRAAFEKLHSILDPEQRARFVDALKRQWQSVKTAHSTDAIVEKMDRELELSDEQESRMHDVIDGLKQIRDAEPDRAERHERWGRILAAFKGDRFVLSEIAPMEDVVAERTKMIEGRLWAAEAVLPILDEKQRAKLAQIIRDKTHER